MHLQIVSLPIPINQEERKLRILLPDDYEMTDKTYRVLYMHDGQNLFEDHTSFSKHSWGIFETLVNEDIHDLIVVGIDNSDYRLFEYSPWPCSEQVKKMTKIAVGGLGDVYASWIINQVKPFIDSNYRTKPDFENTMIAGSSMGAYISIYLATTYPHVFSTIGVFSLASWFNEEVLINHINLSPANQKQNYFISVGQHESSDPNDPNFNEIYLNNSRKLKEVLVSRGIKNIDYMETDDIHNELAWRKVFPYFIRFASQKNTVQ